MSVPALLNSGRSFMAALFLVLAPAVAWAESDEETPRRLGPMDVLEIRVLGEDDLSGVYTLGPKGRVTMALIGETDLSNLTATEAAEKLEALFRDGYLVKPQITVSIQESRGEVVYVFGQVEKPGAIPYREGLTALLAVIEAGNLTRYAAGNKAKVVRGEGKQRVEIKVKLADIIKKGDISKDVPLKAGDFVLVPESFF